MSGTQDTDPIIANAKERNAKRTVIIVGSVLGALLLIAGVTFVIFRIRSGRK